MGTAINEASNTDALVASMQGGWIGSRTAASLVTLYQNGGSVGSNTLTAAGVPNADILLMAQTSSQDFSVAQEAAAFFGGGLTSGQVATLQADIGAYPYRDGLEYMPVIQVEPSGSKIDALRPSDYDRGASFKIGENPNATPPDSYDGNGCDYFCPQRGPIPCSREHELSAGSFFRSRICVSPIYTRNEISKYTCA
jgi:hypothetical protein